MVEISNRLTTRTHASELPRENRNDVKHDRGTVHHDQDLTITGHDVAELRTLLGLPPRDEQLFLAHELEIDCTPPGPEKRDGVWDRNADKLARADSPDYARQMGPDGFAAGIAGMASRPPEERQAMIDGIPDPDVRATVQRWFDEHPNPRFYDDAGNFNQELFSSTIPYFNELTGSSVQGPPGVRPEGPWELNANKLGAADSPDYVRQMGPDAFASAIAGLASMPPEKRQAIVDGIPDPEVRATVQQWLDDHPDAKFYDDQGNFNQELYSSTIPYYNRLTGSFIQGPST